MSNRVQSIERGIDILMALAHGPQTLTEVSRETGLSKGTTFRVLASLGYESLVVKDGVRNVYMLGPGLIRLMQGVVQGVGAITSVARPALTGLWEKSGETITVHVRVGLERMCIEELTSPSPIRYSATVGATAPLHVGAAGHVLLAFMDPEELERTIPTLPLGQITEATIHDQETLHREIARVREDGFATSSGERVPGAAAISVPVLGRQGFLAALSILGPDFRLGEERRAELLPDLQEAAEAVGAALASEGQSAFSAAADGKAS